MKLKKLPLSLVAFFQSLGAIIYCGLVSGFFWYMGKAAIAPPDFWGISLMLFLLVFSAAVTGLLIFGYPAYLVLHGKIKQALKVLGYTFLFSLLIIIIILLIVI